MTNFWKVAKLAMKQRLQALENGQFVSRTKIAKNRQEDSTTILELVCAKKNCSKKHLLLEK